MEYFKVTYVGGLKVTTLGPIRKTANILSIEPVDSYMATINNEIRAIEEKEQELAEKEKEKMNIIERLVRLERRGG